MRMLIIYGSSRMSLSLTTFPKIVFKFPIIRVQMAFHNICRGRSQLLCLDEWNPAIVCSIGFYLFKGIRDNWNEFRFYRKTRHRFLQPTHFSLFGLVNIQDRGEPLHLQVSVFWKWMCDVTLGQAHQDGHHFANPNNFCFNNGLRILDYGSKRTQACILRFGTIVLHSFQPISET